MLRVPFRRGQPALGARRAVALRQMPDSLGSVTVEIVDVAAGLWLWRQRHPSWEPGSGWDPPVSSFAVESRGTTLVLDPLAPPPSARDVWERIEALAPRVVLVLKPDHVRDVDLFVRCHGPRAYGPQHYRRDDVPRTDLLPLRRGH